jgi:hypothetical protein
MVLGLQAGPRSPRASLEYYDFADYTARTFPPDHPNWVLLRPAPIATMQDHVQFGRTPGTAMGGVSHIALAHFQLVSIHVHALPRLRLRPLKFAPS